MKYLLFLTAFLLAACARQYVQNPDPNHAHADFAVYIDSERLDYSGDEHMSTENDHKHDYLHLHDSIGHVIHRHKPGLTLQEFLGSLSVDLPVERLRLRMLVNGNETPFDIEYVLEDMDQILLTTSTDETEIQTQLQGLTDDACRYLRIVSVSVSVCLSVCCVSPSVCVFFFSVCVSLSQSMSLSQ